MKCLVLAGGSSDRLWPLSRKGYPKQFMEMRRGRSMFQEAILRNMPFCDEFIIVTNVRYEKIARAQLQDFQGLDYTVLLEESPLKTAAAVVISALKLQPDDELLIVSTDHIIEGDYNSVVTRVKDVVRGGKLAVVGVQPADDKSEDYHFIDVSSRKIRLTSRRTKHCYLDCGIFAAKVSVILKSTQELYLEQCAEARIGDDGVIELGQSVPALGLDSVWKNDLMELVKAQFQWIRITDISSYYRYLQMCPGDSNIIQNKNKNVEIVNMADDQLIVANGLKDVLIANTKDAVYITGIDSEREIKSITRRYYAEKSKYFDARPVNYEKWGIEEILNRTEFDSVSRITVFPNRTLCGKPEENRVVHYFILDGTASVSSPDAPPRACAKNGSVFFRANAVYEISNTTKRNLVMIRTENADKRVGKLSDENHSCFVKLAPAFKDYFWGGTKIRDVLGKAVGNLDVIAESWELSAHPAGQSKIASGKWKGMYFCDFVEAIGKEELGWKAQAYERFPLMVKFIDAKSDLSIQVHPNDEYAFVNEGDYGKNEMWYILEADEGAFLYLGFNRKVSGEEIRARIANDTLPEVMNKVPVKPGDAYFLQAGTVHAVGAGCFLCEIQQSSNVTYRLYDYGRRDKDGKLRDLHIDKALSVLNPEPTETRPYTGYPLIGGEGYSKQLIGQCKYFSVLKYCINGKLSLPPNESTFQVVIVIGGEGRIGNGRASNKTKLGDTWFFGCRDSIVIDGQCSVLIANI